MNSIDIWKINLCRGVDLVLPSDIYIQYKILIRQLFLLDKDGYICET